MQNETVYHIQVKGHTSVTIGFVSHVENIGSLCQVVLKRTAGFSLVFSDLRHHDPNCSRHEKETNNARQIKHEI